MINEYWREIFGWSWSRQRTWDTCKLRYYYSYIGKWEGFKGDVNREKLRWLGRKTAWYMLQGQLVHEAIESQINQWAIGRPVSKDAAKKLFEYRLRQVEQSPRDFLLDEVNGFAIPKDDYSRCQTASLEMLDSFFDIVWPNYQGYEYIKHEEFDSFEVDGVKVWTKVDLVTRMKDGTVVVTDWKTGRPGEAEDENRNQLLGYLMWASQKLKVDVKRVRAEVRYLRDPGGRPIIISASAEELTRFREFVLNNATSMSAVKSAQDFPASPSDKLCRECNFATVCPEGMGFLDVTARSTPIKIPV